MPIHALPARPRRMKRSRFLLVLALALVLGAVLLLGESPSPGGLEPMVSGTHSAPVSPLTTVPRPPFAAAGQAYGRITRGL